MYPVLMYTRVVFLRLVQIPGLCILSSNTLACVEYVYINSSAPQGRQ
jgi:hypothetical protein